MAELLPVVEIGSLPRLNFILQRKAGRAAGSRRALDEFCALYATNHADPAFFKEFSDVYNSEGLLSGEQKATLSKGASYLAVHAEASGGPCSANLDYVYDGEQRRKEMSEAALLHIKGFERLGDVTSWVTERGPITYTLFACVGIPTIAELYHQEERAFVQRIAGALGAKTKVIETGAVPLAIWNTDHFYYPRLAANHSPRAEYGARALLTKALDENVIIPVMRAHASGGVERMTVDLSRVSQHPGHLPLVIESIGRMNDGIRSPFGLHFCFDDYAAIADARAPDGRRLGDMKNVDALYIESAQRDDARHRDLTFYAEHIGALRAAGYTGSIAPGFVNVHSSEVEPVELLADRIRAAIKADGPERLIVNPDCGLRTRTWEVALGKLFNLSEAAAEVRNAL